ncbi:MAG: A/G-specific adenine glycosylase, partial [Myxococcales bacterium]
MNPSAFPSTVTSALLDWFKASRRPLPWRREPRDPYRVWLSEVMLQQTRVAAMLPRYVAFVARFPTLEALARASLDEVVALFSGLGYYARARNLHAAARAAAALGGLPRSAAQLEKLPGFGP